MPQNSVTDPITDQEPAVKERLIDNQAEGLRSPGRNQILARLWELANLSPEATKNSIAGQVKAMAMIAAIEGLLPGRRISSAPAQAVDANVYRAAWLRDNQDTAPAEPPATTVPTVTTPAISSTYSNGTGWVPNANDPAFDPNLRPTGPQRQPFTPPNRRFGRGR